MTPAQRIEKLIASHGIVKKDLAQKCGTTPVHLSRILNEKAPLTRKMAEKIAAILNVNAEYLTGDSDIPYMFSHEDFIKQSGQTRKKRALVEYLKSLGIHIENTIKIDKNIFQETEDGFIQVNFPETRYTEQEIYEKIKNSNFCVYRTTFEYKNFSKTVDHKEYIYILNNFHRLAQSHFSMLFQSFDDPTVITIEEPIDEIIESKKRERTNNGNP